MSPSKYTPEPAEPLCMRKLTKAFKAGGQEGTGNFGMGAHTAWEEF